MAILSTIRRFLGVAAFAVGMVALVAVPAVRAQAPTGEALIITASVDNDRPYLGQQVTYSLRIYQRQDADLSAAQVKYSPPGFAGFWNSQRTEQDEYEETVGNNEYRVVEVRTVLFASVVGAGEIEPATLEVSTGTSGTPGVLVSPAVAVEVQPLPVPEPAGFTGAVGSLDISASVDPDTGALNEPVLLTVRIAGEGNIEALPDPEWPEFDGWRVIESPVSVESQVVVGQISGSRTYEITLMPQQAGTLNIPQIRYPHFDPVLQRYVERDTPPLSVSIARLGGEPAVPSLPGAADAEEETQALRPIKVVPNSLRRAGTELAESTVYWAAWAVPALAVIGAFAWRRRQVSREASRAQDLRNSALPDARTSLTRATASGVDARVAASEALLSYLTRRLELVGIGATRETLLSRLRERGIRPELENMVSELLSEGETARYTPDTARPGSDGDHADRSLQLMEEIEGALAA